MLQVLGFLFSISGLSKIPNDFGRCRVGQEDRGNRRKASGPLFDPLLTLEWSVRCSCRSDDKERLPLDVSSYSALYGHPLCPSRSPGPVPGRSGLGLQDPEGTCGLDGLFP